ncbi:MAG: hypothetical protein ACXWOL_07830 [Ktedonobacteraceae bacterium]
MSGQPVEQNPHVNQKPSLLRTIVTHIWPLAIGAVFVLFPFDWPGNIWPAYQQIFERVFVGAREHHIGHSTLFLLVGLMLLLSFPILRTRPLLYFGLMISAAIAQELMQDLFKFVIPDLADGLDLLFDAPGFTVAYIAVCGWYMFRSWKKRRKVKTSIV